MDVIPELIEEAIFAEFTPADFENLSKVMSETLAQEMRDYINNPAADSYVVDKIQTFLGDTINVFVLDSIMEERGIYALVNSLVPQNLSSSNVDLDNLIKELSFLEENAAKLMLKLPTRSKADWEKFYRSLSDTIARLKAKGVKLERENTLSIVDANRFVFYIPNAKGVFTNAGVVSSKKRQWVLSLRGAQYIKYCNEHNIPYLNRRSF